MIVKGYLRQIVCTCSEQYGAVLVDSYWGCTNCDLLLPSYLLKCRLCSEQFVKVFTVPGFGDRLPICWDCFPKFNPMYRPIGEVIPPPAWAFYSDPKKRLEELLELDLDEFLR